MRVVIQRVKHASVTIGGTLKSEIGNGMMILVGICAEDGDSDIEWLTKKIVNLRIFDDENGVMNRSVKDVGGEILLVSQFTLMAMTAKGNRPSYIKAAGPDISVPLYEKMIASLSAAMGRDIRTGTFGAEMEVELLNDGPVTIMIDSRNRE